MTGIFYLLTLCLPLATVLIVFGMRYFALTQQAKARLASEDGYRRVAEQAAAAESQNTAALAAIQACLAEIQTRLTGVEKILKDVE